MKRTHDKGSQGVVVMRLATTLLSLAFAGAACDSATSPTKAPSVGGAVYDTAFRPLAGARVEVVDGPLAGMSTITDSHGAFSFPDKRTASIFGQPNSFNLRASKEGYVSAQAFCCGSLYLAPTVPAVTLLEPGAYTLTMVAAEACTVIPEELRTQTFPATVTEAPYGVADNYTISVNYPGFRSDWGFLIGIAGDYAAVPEETTLYWQVEPFRYFELGLTPGRNIISRESGLSMEFSVQYCELKSPQYNCFQSPADQVIVRDRCSSPNNRLTLTRP